MDDYRNEVFGKEILLAEERKNATEVSTGGGIPLRSDELSIEELADLNKSVQEFLKAQVCQKTLKNSK